jgi:hypothetical protein
MKRKLPPDSSDENPNGNTSRRLASNDENPDGVTSRRDNNTSNTNANSSTHHSSRVSRHEVNFDELPYDPADRRRISDYVGQQLQDDIRRKYLARGPFKPPPGFKFPETIIAGHPRRCQPSWFTKYKWLELVKR